ncbi:integrase [Serratia symbiotica]|uniref:integrase n=1 Tax=Serratia symbiotica TaxID=138074 RepID=UPI001320DF23|nr:integrase [Serratia symbiotica]QTP14802.1 integrase [Serratia symbiotica]
MNNLFQFKSKSNLLAEENLSEFINRCKNELTVFGEDLKWNNHIWPNVAVFAKLGVITRKPKPEQIMDSGFLDFAKAYFRYQQGHNPTGTRNELKALRAVEASLLNLTGTCDIKKLNITVLNKAIELATVHYSEVAMYHCGRELERLAKFLTTNKLIGIKLDSWKNPKKRPSDSVKTGSKAKKEREKKLPNTQALNAIAEIFASNPENPRDIFTTSVFALLMSAPSRITEILSLPVDCEYTEVDKNGIERYGLRFFSGKGFEGDIKWIPTAMVEITKEAIKRIKKLTEPSRKFAKWVETNPHKFFSVNESFEVDFYKNRKLSKKEICECLDFKYEKKSVNQFLKNRQLIAEDNYYSLDSLWDFVINKLPSDFPWYNENQKIKYSNALFCMKDNQLHIIKPTIMHSLHKPDATFFNNDISLRLEDGKYRANIFSRHGYRDETGSPLFLRSHQARHLLNTIAQRGGLSNLEIAKWSGRADVKQNRVYNHMTEYEMIKIAELVDITANKKPIISEENQGNMPVTTQQFNLLETGSVHITEYGYCVHDYTMSPCDKFRDCINCSEQVCVKGDKEKLARIKERFEKTSKIYNKAVSNSGDYFGEDRWIEYHKKMLERLKELISIMENPEIDDDAQIKLRGNDFSHLNKVINKEKESILVNKKKQDELSMLDELKLIMGGSNG